MLKEREKKHKEEKKNTIRNCQKGKKERRK